MCAQSLSRVWLFVNPWTVACQVPLSLGFSRQEYLSGLPFPSPGDLPNLGMELAFPALAGWFFTTEQPGKHTVALWCCSVTQSCPTFWGPMDCSTPGFPVLHYLPEFAQTHVHWVGDAIQPSHPLLSPSPPALNLSQHQGLFQWVSSAHQVAELLELQLQSFEWIFRTYFLYNWLFWSCSPRDSQKSLLQHHSSKASILQHTAFFIVQLSHPYMTTGKTIALTRQTFVGKVMSLLFNMLCGKMQIDSI